MWPRVTMASTNSTTASSLEVETTTDSRLGSPWDDATWILTSSFIIFTMQSGFGLLESGKANRKNEVNIMVKNVVDVVFGGITYWAAGYGLSFGRDPGTNAFTGVGFFFLDPSDEDTGTEFSKFIFQASFATTATTIVSGALAERTKLMAYVVFSTVNTFVYSFPAHWVWAESGWLNKMGVVDVAGVGPVHLVGGVTALVGAILLKPRKGRFDPDWNSSSASTVNTVLGLFILWWGWLGFNCGSTFGISGGKWKLAARAAAVTVIASCGGGATAFFLSYIVNKKKFEVQIIVNGILGALVSVTGLCAVTTCWAALVIGSVATVVAWSSELLMLRLKVDDPVGATSVHLSCAVWGLLACGIFAKNDTIQFEFNDHNGLIWGGDFYLLGVQSLAVLAISVWSAATSLLFFLLIQVTIGLRVSPEEEELGSDFVEHNLPLFDEGSSRASSNAEYVPRGERPEDSKESGREEEESKPRKRLRRRWSWQNNLCLCLCKRSEETEVVLAKAKRGAKVGVVTSQCNVAFDDGEGALPQTWALEAPHLQNGGGGGAGEGDGRFGLREWTASSISKDVPQPPPGDRSNLPAPADPQQ